MSYKEKYLKYKIKYNSIKKFYNLAGGLKSYAEALQDIFALNRGTNPNNLDSMEANTILLEKTLNAKNVSPCHGIEHAKTVMYHAWCALEAFEIDNKIKILDEDKIAVLLAALLHDADDQKFFPENKNYENLRSILVLNGKSPEFIDKVVYMVSIVSASKNGDTIPPAIIKSNEYLLIPRYADRLEAIGLIGVERCHTYTKNVSNEPLYLESTPKPKSEEEIWKFATMERYKAYKGKSASMIDHFYDKLLRLIDFPIRNSYFD